jgi:hypothetical protein
VSVHSHLQSFLYCAFQAWNFAVSAMGLKFAESVVVVVVLGRRSAELLVLGTSDPLNVSASLSLFLKKWKNPSSALGRRRTCVQALPWFSTCSLGLLRPFRDFRPVPLAYSGPSPIRKTTSYTT